MLDRFFFYGTLMSGQHRDVFDVALERIGRATIRGDLYAVGASFPAMVPGNGTVVGELWRCTDPELVPPLLRVLDMIEGFKADDEPDSLYVRRTVPLLTGGAPEAWAYQWNMSTNTLERIDDGDWRAWTARRNSWDPEGVTS